MHTNRLRKFWTQLTPKKFDTYLIVESLGPFLGGILFFTFIYLMFQALRLADFFIIHGIPGLSILKIALFLGLSFLPMALPIAFLISILVGFGRLSADSELVALKASGVSLQRMSAPMMFFCSLVVVFSLALNLELAPWSLRNYWQMLSQIGAKRVVSSINEGSFTAGFFDLLIFTDKIDKDKNELNHVFIYDEREPKSPLTVVANKGKLIPVKSENEFGSSLLLKLDKGNIHRSEIAGETYQKIDFDIYKLFLEISGESAATQNFKPKMLSYSLLNQRIREAEPETQNYYNLVTEKWRRFSIALSAVGLVFLGMGFGTVRTRSVKSGAAIITFVVISAYWALLTYFTDLSHHGTLSPVWALQVPNLLILAVGLYSFYKSTW